MLRDKIYRFSGRNNLRRVNASFAGKAVFVKHILDDGSVYVTEGLEKSFSFAKGYKNLQAEVVYR